MCVCVCVCVLCVCAYMQVMHVHLALAQLRTYVHTSHENWSGMLNTEGLDTYFV